MVLATLFFTIMVGAVKTVRQELEALEVIVWRSAISAPLAFLMCLFPRRGTAVEDGAAKVFAIKARRVLTLRVLLGTGAMVCFFTSAKGLALADLSILSRLQPIVIAVLAPFVLGAAERSPARIWLLLGAGLFGSAMIIGPGLEVGNVYGLWALAATVLSAGAHLAVRRLGATDDPRAVVFWFQVGACAIAFSAYYAITGDWIAIPEARWWPWLATVGIFATLGQIAMTFAYKTERASRVAAASYAAPLFGLIADVFFFEGWPAPLALLGGIIVTAAGLALIWRRAE